MIESAPTQSGNYMIRLVMGADPVVKLVMLLLVGMSIMCWAIIAYKFKEMKSSRLEASRFKEMFRRSTSLEDLVVKSSLPQNPLQNVFRKGIADVLRHQKESKGGPKITLERIEQQVGRAVEDEVAEMEKYIPFLATTGSSAPYIGLFGTVWGILGAFWQIGKAGTSSLAVVGPYIAEALIATAMGLAAAIPAVIFYNYFVTKIRGVTRDLDNFSDDFVTRVNTEYF
jgi:biopolymer transport protein TolQ